MANNQLEKFDLKVVHDNFLTCLFQDDDINLKFYLESYEELNKFFVLMGTVFNFVSKDLKSKMEILTILIQSENVSDFETVKKMIEYEKQNQLLFKEGYTSGSRTLLRLHRGLDFIREFLQSISKIEDNQNTAGVCREAYERTLAKHHSFIIRQGAKLAMYTMPNREQLLIRVCGGSKEDIQLTLDILPKTLEITAIVIERIHKLYLLHDLHTLP